MTKFYLPVCSENLVKFLSYGLISADRTRPLSGRNSYVPDALSRYNGEIPLFIGKVPSGEIKRIKKFDKYLHACILEIDIKKIKGGSFRTNQNTSGSFPLSKLDNKEVKRISIVGPIPTTLINVVYFEDKEAKDDFVANFKSANITPPKKIELWKKSLLDSDKAEKDLLVDSQSASEDTLPAEVKTPQIELTAEHWHKISAYGGALALAFSVSKNGQKSTDNFKTLASKPYLKNSEINTWNAGDDFSFISNFLLSSPSQPEYDAADFKIQLYAGILNIICSADEGRATKELVHFLTSGEFDDFGEKFGKFANSIANDIDGIHQTQYTVRPSEHLSSIRNDIITQKKSSLLSLGLAMLAFKDSAEKIINYNQDDFEEFDYFYYALLAGMRAGLHKIPNTIRNIDGMNEFVSTKMTQMAHYIIGSDLEFKEVKPPKAIIELITMSAGFDFPLWLIEKLKIDKHVRLTIKTKEGFSVRKDGTIVLSGSHKLKLEFNDIEYTKQMTKTKSQDIPYKDIYKKLAKK